jgi:hypothetical protein
LVAGMAKVIVSHFLSNFQPHYQKIFNLSLEFH